MRTNVNWGTVEASTDGDFTRLPAGPYVAKVVNAIDNANKEYVEVIFDIAEGEHANYYSDDWGKNHPYAHHFFMSYKDTALGMLKGRLEAIQASNQGFDPFAAWDAGRLDMFTNRLVGLNLQEEEYEYDGEVKTRLNVCQVVPAQDVRDGKIKAREMKKLNGGSTHATSTSAPVAADVYNGAIPFD